MKSRSHHRSPLLLAYALPLLFPYPVFAQKKLSIYFATAQSTITKEIQYRIDSFSYSSDILFSRPLEILGYTDSVGATAANLGLSWKRAVNVKKYLISSGVDSNNIRVTTGYGEDKTESPGDLQRRVDIILDAGGRHDDTSKQKTLSSNSQLVVGGKFILNILFYDYSNQVKPDSKNELTGLFEFLQQHKTMHVQLEGHTCCPNLAKGRLEASYMQLSFQRAKAIYDYLVSKGIDKTRLSYYGWGSTKPLVYPEKTKADMTKNMRVEVKIVSL